jgi:RHS repeat-associated protein
MSSIIQRAWSQLARAGLFVGLALASALAPAQTVTYFHNDASGMPVLATDAGGNVVWKENYRPYGDRLNNPSAEAGNAIGFAGKPFDASTGLSYMGARYYDPGIGRFMGVDAAPADPGSVHGFNRYAYANNNPYKYVDPDGHSPLDVGFLVFDLGKLGYALYKGDGVNHALVDVAMSVAGVVVPIPGAGEVLKGARALEHGAEAARAAQAVEHGVEAARGGEAAAKGATEGSALTSRAARRDAMRDAGIPTSQQPVSQSRNASGREYSYDVPAPGGSTQRMSVQQQTMDRSHPGQAHWEAGRVKTDPRTGAARENGYGRPALANGKSKVDY